MRVLPKDADFVVEMMPPSLECECGYTGTVDEKQIRESSELKVNSLLM